MLFFSVKSDKKLDNDIVWNESDVNESRAVNQLNDEVNSVDINLYGEDIDQNVIVSKMILLFIT